MGGNIPGKLIGTAPDASYWLIRTEDAPTEFIIEEDNWVAAAEFADSVGADVINSSLGYTEYDDKLTSHNYRDMDGKTTRVTKGANTAALKGMLVFSSAGNDGNKPWRKISAPADGDKVIAVGAVNKSGVPAAFTSQGPASDGDVKPNVSSLGLNTWLQQTNGTLGYSSGTSFSSPIMAGMVTCLWQANPKATAIQIKQAIEKSAHLFSKPDSILGYGIPDMKVADIILKTMDVKTIPGNTNWLVYPNPFTDKLILKYNGTDTIFNTIVTLFAADGSIIRKIDIPANETLLVLDLSGIPAGILFLRIGQGHNSEPLKIFKVR
jgi:subtilisin family serine protease